MNRIKALVLTIIVVCSGCLGEPWQAAYLTQDPDDTYSIDNPDGMADSIIFAANPANTDTNTRAIATVPGTSVCATTTTPNPVIQPGLSFVGPEGTITLTRNVWFAAAWLWNVNFWPGGGQLSNIGQWDASQIPISPIRVCGRYLNGTVQIRWNEGEWSQPIAVPLTSVTRTGVYGGHIPAGGSITFTAITLG